MFGSNPKRKLDKEFFVVSEMIVMRSPKKVFDSHAEILRDLRGVVGDDQYFEALRQHGQRTARIWADAGVDADALMRTLFRYCSTYDWLDSSMQ